MTDDRVADRPVDQSGASPRANIAAGDRRTVESIKDYATQIGIRLGRAREAVRGHWDLGWMTLRALLIFLPLAALATLAFYLIYDNEAANTRDLMKVRQEKMVDLGQMIFSTAFDSIAADVRYLAEEPNPRRWVATRDPKLRAILIEQYLSFAKYQGYYDQIRLIDLDGREVVRINWNSGALSAVPDDRLQDKSSRDYVRAGMKLAAGEIYVSAFRSQRRRRRHRAADQADDPSGGGGLRCEWPQAGTDRPQLSGRIAPERVFAGWLPKHRATSGC